VLSGPGRIKIVDVATGRVILDRAMTIGWSDVFHWSPDSRYLFVTEGSASLDVVPAWSATARIRSLQLPSHDYEPDTQQFFVTLRTAGNQSRMNP